MFQEDGNILQFASPRVSAAIAANTFIIQGKPQIKSLTECLPDIIPQLGTDSINSLKKLAESYQAQMTDGAAEEVPDLVENFDA